MMRNAVCHGAEGATFAVVVGVDDAERKLGSHVHDKLADAP